MNDYFLIIGILKIVDNNFQNGDKLENIVKNSFNIKGRNIFTLLQYFLKQELNLKNKFRNKIQNVKNIKK